MSKPLRKVLGDPQSQPAFGASNVTASAVTRKFVDAVGHTEQGDRVLGRKTADRRRGVEDAWLSCRVGGADSRPDTADEDLRQVVADEGICRKAVIFSGPKMTSRFGLGALFLAI